MSEAMMTRPMAKSKGLIGPSLKNVSRKGRDRPNRIVLYAVEGWGKCLGAGTPVLMYDGTTKAVEEVQEGDLLMGPDSKPRKVSGLHRGAGPLFRVTPTKGDSYVVNGNHILSLKESTDRSRGNHHRIVNIPVREYLGKSAAWRSRHLGWRASVEWPERDLPIDPYLLGCWLGDGTATKPDITTPDEEVVGAMRKYAESAGAGMRVGVVAPAGKATTYKIGRTKTGRAGRSNEFVDALRQMGVYGNKHIPHEYKTACRGQRLELLAGLLDADGFMYGNCFDAAFASETMARDLAFLARSVGMAAYVTPCEKGATNSPTGARGVYWRVKISGDTHLIPNRIERRQAKVRKQRKDALVTGIRVEPEGVGDFYGFELDGDHLFLLGDFTVTHNTSMATFTPDPIFLMTRGEDGLRKLLANGLVPETAHFDDEATSWNELLMGCRGLLVEEHPFKVLVVDVLNGAARLCVDHVTKVHFGGDEAKFNDYGRGWKIVPAEWQKFLDVLGDVNRSGVTVLLLAHSDVKAFKNPEGQDYDRYVPRMAPQLWEPTQEWADMILFGQLETFVQGDKKAAKGKAAGGQNRILRCERTAVADAKNRHGLPDVIDCGIGPENAWNALAAALVAGRKTAPAEAEAPAQEG